MKEYNDHGELKFEGKYLNGERNGKGKEYYDNGRLKFEGEYLYGVKWNGKIYNSHDNMVYEIKDGKGNLIVFYQGEKIFEGEYLYGNKWNGKGKESHNGKIEFEGEYLNGKNGMEKLKNIMILEK